MTKKVELLGKKIFCPPSSQPFLKTSFLADHRLMFSLTMVQHCKLMLRFELAPTFYFSLRLMTTNDDSMDGDEEDTISGTQPGGLQRTLLLLVL